jgi:pheromone shutdown protein TraB
MIGTAHISEESANLVRRTIKTVKPDVVMIELDPKRIGRVVGSNQTLEEAGKNTNSIKLMLLLYCTVLR